MLFRRKGNVSAEAWRPPTAPMLAGYQRLYFDHVLQASRGAEFDFLIGHRGAAVPRKAH